MKELTAHRGWTSSEWQPHEVYAFKSGPPQDGICAGLLRVCMYNAAADASKSCTSKLHCAAVKS